MTLNELTVTEFTKEIASKTSVPGGGGASALVGAIAIALGDMVGEYTIGKKKYADVEDDVKELMAKAQELRLQFLECIEGDAEAFEPLSKAYAIPKDDPTRDEIMEKCLRDAAAVPFKILELSCEALQLMQGFAKKGSTLMISDAATGAAMLSASMRGAYINVRINTKLMKDREYANALNSKAENLVKDYSEADKLYSDILANM